MSFPVLSQIKPQAPIELAPTFAGGSDYILSKRLAFTHPHLVSEPSSNCLEAWLRIGTYVGPCYHTRDDWARPPTPHGGGLVVRRFARFPQFEGVAGPSNRLAFNDGIHGPSRAAGAELLRFGLRLVVPFRQFL